MPIKNRFIMSNTIEVTESGEEIIKNAGFNRFGLISAILLIVGCLGGITVGLGAVNDTFALILVVIPTMTTLSLLLAVAPMKAIFTSGIIAVTIDVILLCYYLLL